MPRSKGSFASGSALAALLAGTATLTAVPAVGRAEQFVLFDAKFTFTKADADNGVPNKSHYYVTSTNANANFNRARPTNWTAPVDYRNGTVHIRTEAIAKPAGSEITQWFLCYIANRGVAGTSGYGCVGTGTYKEQGVYEREEAMTSWWNNTAVDWTQGIKQVDMIMKDFGSGNGGNYTHLRTDPEHFFPTTMRVTVIQVSKGSTYDPNLVPGLPSSSADGGPGGSTADAAASGDAPAESTSGSGGTTDAAAAGATGTGGATGSGGVAGSTGTGGVAPGPVTGSGGAPGPNPGGGGGAGGSGAVSPGIPTSSPGACSLASDSGTPGSPMAGFVTALAVMGALAKRHRRRRDAAARAVAASDH